MSWLFINWSKLAVVTWSGWCLKMFLLLLLDFVVDFVVFFVVSICYLINSVSMCVCHVETIKTYLLVLSDYWSLCCLLFTGSWLYKRSKTFVASRSKMFCWQQRILRRTTSRKMFSRGKLVSVLAVASSGNININLNDMIINDTTGSYCWECGVWENSQLN